MSLYTILDLNKLATAAQIKAAYKSKAQKMHPDKGGEIEAFQTLQHAYAVLSDLTRRMKYDETGSTEVPPSEDGQAIQLFANYIQDAITSCDHKTNDIVEIIANLIRMKSTGIEDKRASLQEQIEKLEDVKKRFKVKQGENRFAQIMEAAIRELQLGIENLQRPAELLILMATMLKEYSYTVDEPEPVNDPLGVVNNEQMDRLRSHLIKMHHQGFLNKGPFFTNSN